MKHKIFATCILVISIFCMSFSVQAQEILSIFKKYGNEHGVTMLVASKELMKEYKIKMFKSIIFEDAGKGKILPDIRRAISKDKEGALHIKESIQDGLLMSGYYQLLSENAKVNRYLIFKISKANKATLIYVEGELTPEELVELLK